MKFFHSYRKTRERANNQNFSTEPMSSGLYQKNPNRSFSEGTSRGFAQIGGNGNRILFAAVCIILSALVAFGFGFGGVMFANMISENSWKQSLHLDDPSSVLEKDESAPSELGSAGADVLSVSQVVNKVKDAVVTIEATISTSSDFGGAKEKTQFGSGVIVSNAGYILTCHSIINGAKSIDVTLGSENTYEAALVGSDSYSDVAVLKIDPKEPLTSVKQGCSANLIIDEFVVAIDNPSGTLSGSVTTCVVRDVDRTVSMPDGTYMTLIPTDAIINSANSGGALFNLKGELIGVVDAKYASSDAEKTSFVIPIDYAYKIQMDLIEYGYRRNIADDGLETMDVTQEGIDSNKNYHDSFGIYSAGVYVVSSKYCTELKNADRIISIEGVAVNTTKELENQFKKCSVGDTVTIVASRAGEKFTVKMKAQEYVPDYLNKTK